MQDSEDMACEEHSLYTCKVCNPKGRVLGKNQHPLPVPPVLTGQVIPGEAKDE